MSASEKNATYVINWNWSRFFYAFRFFVDFTEKTQTKSRDVITIATTYHDCAFCDFCNNAGT